MGDFISVYIEHELELIQTIGKSLRLNQSQLKRLINCMSQLEMKLNKETRQPARYNRRFYSVSEVSMLMERTNPTISNNNLHRYASRFTFESNLMGYHAREVFIHSSINDCLTETLTKLHMQFEKYSS